MPITRFDQRASASGPSRIARLTLITAMLLVAGPLAGQGLRGTISDAARSGVPGIVVQLLDSTDAVAASALSDANGAYTIRAPRPGTYRVRALRIGFRPDLSEPIALATGESRDHPISLAGVRVELATVRVEETAVCGRGSSRDDRSAFSVWDQAMTSVASASIVAGGPALDARLLRIVRTLERDGRRVRTQEATELTGDVSRPWTSLPANALRAYGYATADQDGVTTFRAPDLRVLSSTVFLEDHCLRAVTSPNTDEVGVRFEPAPHRGHIAEIVGTAWLARASAELRRIEFTYVNVPGWPEGAPIPAGVEMDFAQLEGGGVILSRWEIRMPALERETRTAPQLRVAAINSSGGEILMVRRGTDTLYVRPRLTVRGIVLDSSSARPVPGATVRLLGTSASATTAADGRFRIAEVLPGEYNVAVTTPSLDSIRVSSLATHLVAAGSPDLTLRVQTAQQIAASYCGSVLEGAQGRRRGALLGSVELDADTLVADGVPVVADWVELGAPSATDTVRDRTHRRLETRTDRGGNFRLCGVPLGTALTVRALPPTGRSDISSVRLTADRRFATLRLAVDPDRPGLAVFRGVVVADSILTPLPDVEVALPDLGLTTRTNARGDFRIAGVPPGTHRVIARRIGLGGLEARITFGANDEEERRIVLSDITQLAQVDVIGTIPDNAMREYAEQRAMGLGRFMTRDRKADPLHVLCAGVRGWHAPESRLPDRAVRRERTHDPGCRGHRVVRDPRFAPRALLRHQRDLRGTRDPSTA